MVQNRPDEDVLVLRPSEISSSTSVCGRLLLFLVGSSSLLALLDAHQAELQLHHKQSLFLICSLSVDLAFK